jgi:hypothetical protein
MNSCVSVKQFFVDYQFPGAISWRMKIILVPVTLLLFLCAAASAQSRFAGNYELGTGYKSHYLASEVGTFGFGTATASRDGVVAYTVYYPGSNNYAAGTGTIDKKGVFSMNNGVTGTVRLVSKVIDAIGDFSDPYGSGFFGLSKR